jgi:hypothetical protein
MGAVRFRLGQAPAWDVHLQGVQDEPGHGSVLSIASRSATNSASVLIARCEFDRFCSVNMLSPRFTASGPIVVAGEETRLVGEGQNRLDRLPQDHRVTPGEVRACRAEVRHEDGVMDEGGVADDTAYRGEHCPGEKTTRAASSPIQNCSPSANNRSHCDPLAQNPNASKTGILPAIPIGLSP